MNIKTYQHDYNYHTYTCKINLTRINFENHISKAGMTTTCTMVVRLMLNVLWGSMNSGHLEGELSMNKCSGSKENAVS